MTSSHDESDRSEDLGITDDQLPEDLQADENPLAEGLDPGESAGDLLEEGKPAEQDPEQDAERDQQGTDDES